MRGEDIDGKECWTKEYDDWVKVDFDTTTQDKKIDDGFEYIELVVSEDEEDEKSSVNRLYLASKYVV